MFRLCERVLLVLLGIAGISAATAAPHVGEVIAVAFEFCPAGWAQMNGQLLPIAGNENLFQLMGNSYGGDGTTTFALPLVEPIYTTDRKPLIQCIALSGTFPSQP